jgi:CDP-2,3-bis-(O-geranylgeranyl)-sn-glycerol synthase
MFELFILAIWLMLPAYIANPAAALFGGGTPIDLGRNFVDNKRILGDGKTFRGLIIGTLCGMAAGIAQVLLAPYLAPYFAGVVDPATFTQASYVALVTMPFGALAGDIVKSFFKRRVGLKRGAMWPLADQLDFVIGAWALTYLLDSAWLTANFTLWVIVIVLVITPILHVVTNLIGFKIGKKDVPW